MSLFQKCIDGIQQYAQVKKEGRFNGIPYPYARFREFIPSIDKESVICITSYTGAAKSKFVRYTYALYPYEFSLLNDYPILIDLYALEDSATKVFKNMLCHWLFMKHKVNISLFDLDSRFRELSSNVIKLIREGENYLQDLNNKIRIKDTIANPYGIHLDVMKTASELGEVQYEEFVDKAGEKFRKIVGFTPKDDTHWIAILDNLNNIDKEKQHFNQKEAMDNFVMKQVRLLYSKILKMTWVIIHQQALEAEKQQFTSAGGSILEKIKPSLANLGGTKEVVRSYHLVLSLFAPHKFKIENYKGYDTKIVGNNFRELEVLKSNDGFDNISAPLYFDGTSEFFRELPHSERQPKELNEFYKWLEDDRFKRKSKHLLF